MKNSLSLIEASAILAMLTSIAPPPRYRDTRIAGSYDDNVQPRARDEATISAAEAKRLRKAAKRRESMK